MSELFRVRNWVFATMCISVHYNGTDSVAFEQISQRLQIPRFVEFPIAIRKYGNVLIALAWCLLFLFYARSSARDVLRVYEMSMCVRRVSNLFFICIVDFYDVDVGKYWHEPARLKTQPRDNRKIRQGSSHATTFYRLPYKLTFLQSPTLKINIIY